MNTEPENIIPEKWVNLEDIAESCIRKRNSACHVLAHRQ